MLNANRSGVGTYVRALNFGWAFASAGHEVTLCTVSAREKWRMTRRQARGVAILEMPNWGDRLWPGWGSGPLDIAHRLRLLQRQRFDLVYGFEYQPNVAWPIYLTRPFQSYRLLSDWCDWFAGGANRFRDIRLAHRFDQFFEERIRYLADRVTVISSVLEARALGLGLPRERVVLIEEGVDTDYIRPLPQAEMRARFGLPPDVPLLVSITGGDMRRAVEILAETRRQVPEARLLVIGFKQPAVAQTAARLGLSAAVYETGRVSDDDLPRYLACADVCFFHLEDTLVDRARWPHKVNDFLAAGRATVVSPVGDIGPFFRRHAVGGVAVTNADFADTIAALLRDPDRREACARRARQVAVEQLDWRVLREKIVRLAAP